MKNLLFVTAFSISVSFGFAQEGQTSPGSDQLPIAQGQVPTQVSERFNREYPGIAGSWSRDGDNFRVEFTDPNSRMSHVIIYDRNGDVVRRESEVDQIPQAINDYYQKNYPGERMKTFSTEDQKGVRGYYARHNNEVVHFDHEGKFMAPVKEKTASGRVKSDR